MLHETYLGSEHHHFTVLSLSVSLLALTESHNHSNKKLTSFQIAFYRIHVEIPVTNVYFSKTVACGLLF